MPMPHFAGLSRLRNFRRCFGTNWTLLFSSPLTAYGPVARRLLFWLHKKTLRLPEGRAENLPPACAGIRRLPDVIVAIWESQPPPGSLFDCQFRWTDTPPPPSPSPLP